MSSGSGRGFTSPQPAHDDRDLYALYSSAMNGRTSTTTIELAPPSTMIEPLNMPTSTRNAQTSMSTPRIFHLPSPSTVRSVPLISTPEIVRSWRLRPLSQRFVYSVYGRPPASKRTLETLPRVEIVEKDEECVICLEELWKGDVATELPCQHKYHFKCVKKWLEIHATCPQCRYEMPLEGEKK